MNTVTGSELKQIRENLNMNQDEFGAIFGYHQPQVRISEFERGVRPIPTRVVSACAYLATQQKISSQAIAKIS